MPRTERIARWSATHPRRVVGGWIVLVALVSVLASTVGGRMESTTDQESGQAATGTRMQQSAGLIPDASETILITGTGTDRSATSAQSRRTAQRVAAAIQGIPHVGNVQWSGADQIAADGAARAVTFDLTAHGPAVDDDVVPVQQAVAKVAGASPGFQLREFGDASIDRDMNAKVGHDLSRSERVTAPIALIVLLATFGALVAAGLPLLIGGASVFAAFGLGTLASNLLPQTTFAPDIVSMLGIALGIDYTLFVLRREREERAAGHGRIEAIARAAGSSGTAVVISGVTVLVALCGLLLSGTWMFASMGVASMLVVLAVLLASVFVLPAILAILGDRLERGRLPRWLRSGRGRHGAPAGAPRPSRVWGAIARTAARRPMLTILVAGGALLLVASPTLHMRTGQSTTAMLPHDLPSIRAFTAFSQHFPGQGEPAAVVINTGSADHARLDAAIATLRRDAQSDGTTTGPGTEQLSANGRTIEVDLPLRDSAHLEHATAELRALRGAVSDTVGRVPGAHVAVTGDTAESVDMAHTLSSHMPLVLAVVLGTAFIVLLLAFGSLVVPLTAVILNLLSVGAAYGFLVWGFQERHLHALGLPVANTGVVVSWMPLFLFVLLFGLSMDYHVFMVSRIRERVVDGWTTRDAVVDGVASSASTITGAALIMVAVFAAFAISEVSELQQMGAGLAVAIIVDATVIRGLLVPAIMTLLGGRNWYLPRWLGWLPRIESEGRRVEPGVSGQSRRAAALTAP